MLELQNWKKNRHSIKGIHSWVRILFWKSNKNRSNLAQGNRNHRTLDQWLWILWITTKRQVTVLDLADSNISKTLFIGDAVLSHGLFQKGRPKLCKLMQFSGFIGSESVTYITCTLVLWCSSSATFQVTMDSSHVSQYLWPSQGIGTYPIPTRGMFCTMDPALNNRSNQLSELVGMTSKIDSTRTLLQRQVKKMPGISFPRSQQTADAVLSTSKYLARNCGRLCPDKS